MRGLLFDFRLSLRAAARAPVFTASVIALLALGIGASTVIFAAIDALLLRPLPVTLPEQLVRLGVQRSPSHVDYFMPYLYSRFLAGHANAFSEAFAAWPIEMALDSGEGAESITGEVVSGNYYRALGLEAMLGRVTDEADERAQAQVAVLSHGFWLRAFWGRKDVISRTIRLRGAPFTIAGVLPPGFVDIDLESRVDVRIPASTYRLWIPAGNELDLMPCTVYLRLKDAAAIAQAQSEIEALYPAMVDAENALRSRPPDVIARLKSLHPVLSSVERGSMAMRKQFVHATPVLLAAIMLMLLMVSANVSGLMLARAETRASDAAVRLSLGASRWSIMRRALTDALLPAAAGGLAGWAAARACGPMLLALLPARRPLAVDLSPDWRVIAFTAVACIAAAVLMSVLPAWRASRTDFSTVMARGALRTTAPRTGRTLAAAQVALATVLLGGGFVLVRTLEALRNQDPGFERDNLVVMTLNPRMAGVKGQQIMKIFDEVIRRARALPGVTAVAVSERAPMRGTGFVTTVVRPGTEATFRDALNVSLNGVSPGYFATLGIRILEGRGLEESDASSKPQRIVVNRGFARRFFPNESALGKTIAERVIVGVVNDAAYRNMRDAPPTFYDLLSPEAIQNSDGLAVYVRVSSAPERMIHELRAMLRRVGPGLAPTEIATMQQDIDTALWQERLLAKLSGMFAGIALLVAALGIFATLAYAVARRTREIGIRAAVGADRRQIATLITRDTAWTILPGMAAGIAAYTACSRALAAVAYGVSPIDPPSLIAAAALLTIAALIATLPPALAAARIDPAAALRSE
jgi:predicted permease